MLRQKAPTAQRALLGFRSRWYNGPVLRSPFLPIFLSVSLLLLWSFTTFPFSYICLLSIHGYCGFVYARHVGANDSGLARGQSRTFILVQVKRIVSFAYIITHIIFMYSIVYVTNWKINIEFKYIARNILRFIVNVLCTNICKIVCK